MTITEFYFEPVNRGAHGSGYPRPCNRRGTLNGVARRPASEFLTDETKAARRWTANA